MATTYKEAGARARLYSYSRRSLWLIGGCFVLSGATGLIYEILWARMLGLVFGATTFAVSAVLAAFMGGLALGSALAGRYSGKVLRPLRVYGLIEICIALYAVAVPLLFRLVDKLYVLIWNQFHPGYYGFNLWRFALSCAVLLAPTTLMGATLPVLSSAILRSRKHTSTSVTRLYTCNLVGAILGTLCAGFVLLPNYGVRATIWTAAVVNILIGLAAIIVDGRGRQDFGEAAKEDLRGEAAVLHPLKEDEAHVVSHVRTDEGQAVSHVATQALGSQKFWLWCAFVSGFVTISTQVAWTRVLTMVIGSSSYAFTLVVALFLIGLAGGAYLVGRKRSYANLRRVILAVELLIAASLVLSLWAANQTPTLLINLGINLKINSWLGLLALQTLAAAVLLLIPALLMGMVMPLVLVWASVARRESSVRLVGRSYAVNTLGAIAGAFGAGFVLIPKGNTRLTIIAAAALSIIVAGAAFVPEREGADSDLYRSLKAGATVALLVLLFFIAPQLNLGSLSIGAYDGLVRVLAKSQGSIAESEDRKFSPETNRLLFYKEGPTATVSVREDWGIHSLAINGRTNASDKDDMPTQVMVGVLPTLIAPRLDNALMVGFASGVSTGSILQSPIKNLECVELEPATREASQFFNHVNNHPLEDARLRLIIDDARTYLHVTDARYDIIVSEPSHPWVPGVANLFTKEFFALAGNRLQDEGVFVQWVQIYQLSTENLRTVLATYRSVFPHVMIFRVGGAARGKDLILVGSRSPLNFARLSERLSDERIKKELARVNINGAEDVLSWYVCDERELEPALAGAVINTDDNMRVENRAPREAFLPLMNANAVWIENLAARARMLNH
ncbi:MAG TPA: fused MFS/spermidine synthase [Pyrinomonadaceae bacterium]